jgi:hypothetical protein
MTINLNQSNNQSNNEESDREQDSSLVFFLKYNRVIAPSGSPDLEAKLMAQINLAASKPTVWKRLAKLWVIPLVLASGLAILTNSFSDRTQQPFIATNNRELNSQDSPEKQQLEASLVKDWLVFNVEEPEVNSFYGDVEIAES